MSYAVISDKMPIRLESNPKNTYALQWSSTLTKIPEKIGHRE